ncbi:alpha/beta fold hydrolase [Streptomyces nitrosporeus]|uniref:alpha/beta fold hydrolase n=1 Tax=Streptomyces nitrosporeus TaxID=28894 RepID=UPI0039A10161
MTDRPHTTVRTGSLKVPGATLHHEVRGSGPLLLLMAGGSADAGLYESLAADLADRWTVITYDPRCYSRSRLDAPPADQRVTDHSDDALRLIEHIGSGGERACVFGSSASAVVALDLLSRHPERLGTVVAHEPPVVEVLPDPETGRALFAEVRAAFRRDGSEAAAAVMSAGIGEGASRPQDEGAASAPPPLTPETLRRMRANLPVFLEHMLCPFTGYVPDTAALEAAADRLVLAVGEESGEQLTARPVRALAQRFGRKATPFPGGHLGVVERPAEFAAALRAAFTG